MRCAPALVIWCAVLSACANGLTLVADLKTDLRPGLEFASAETQITRESGDEVAHAALPAYTSSHFLSGERAIEAHGLTPGSYLVSLQLLDRDGHELVRRNTRVRLDASTAITVLVTRDCRGVLCPTAADAPEATECLGGGCVRPECVIEDPTACPEPACRSDADCRFAAGCAVGACVSGSCLALPDDTRCGPRAWCDPALGCQPLGITEDDGGAQDTGGLDSGSDDAGRDDVGPGVDASADGGACADPVPCDTGHGCELGRTDCSGACVHDAFVGAGTECRASRGVCDDAETCSGASADCPTDALRRGVCRGASGPCDAVERCDGATADCPGNEAEPDGTSCGATWRELSCGPFDVDTCQGGACVRRAGFGGAATPSCGVLADLCGFAPGNCCGSGGWFCVDEPGNRIYGSSRDCAQCCLPGRCCEGGNPAGPCT